MLANCILRYRYYSETTQHDEPKNKLHLPMEYQLILWANRRRHGFPKGPSYICFTLEILKPRELAELSLIFPTYLKVIIGYLRENSCKTI